MAGQNIISLGIDTSSFTAKKKQTLNEFIDLFNKLKKYENLKINPVLGEGLTSFNNSIKQSSALLDELNTKISTLTTLFSGNQTVSSKAASANQAINTSLQNISTSSAQAASSTNKLNTSINSGVGSAINFGNALKGIYNQVRIIAYALPGIGIAGVFNLVFEGIEKLVDGLGILNNSEIESSKFTAKLNDTWLEFEQTLLNVYNTLLDINRLEIGTFQSLSKETGISKGRGISPDQIFIKEIQDLTTRFQEAENGLARYYKDNIAALEKSIREDEEAIAQKATRIESLKPGGFEREVIGPKHADAEIELRKSEIEQLKFDVSDKKKVYEEYYDARQALAVKNAEFIKFQEDQERKRIYETSKSIISVKVAEFERIFNAEISSEKQKESALENIRKQRAESARAELNNIINNISTTPKEREIAEQKFNDSIKKIDIQFQEDRLELNEEYRQRRLKAIETINKSEIEKEAIKNERIYKDDNKTFEERLSAYSNYVHQKQVIQDLEYELAIEALKLKANDPTAKKEVAALASERDLQKANIQADAQRQAFEIVYSNLQKELKTVIDVNQAENLDNIKKYTEELIIVNDSFRRKKISYEKWNRERQELDRKYRYKVLDDAVTDDEQDIRRLEQQLHREQRVLEDAKKKELKTKDEFEFSKVTGEGDPLEREREYREAIGEREGAEKAAFDTQVEINKKEAELAKDKLRRELDAIDKEKHARRELYDLNKKIIDALYNLTKTAIDADYERRIQRIEDERDAVVAGYDAEIDAVERSSLSAKDKAALDIRLAAEKQTADKQAAAEEKKIKRDQAIIDRELSVAHILWNTEEAISKTYAQYGGTPLALGIAIRQGILGALEVATVLAVPIPSYAEGTLHHQGGLARFGEKGPELVKEPYKSPYLAMKETVSFLPRGTEIVPIEDGLMFSTKKKDEGWEQVRWLAKTIKKNKPNVKVSNTVNVDLGFENYKRRMIYG